MAKTIAQIQAKHEHTYQDEDGKTVKSQTFKKDFTFFEDIEYLYSKNCPDGIKIDSFHVALYCRFLSYQANGSNCYESHATLARKHKTSSSTVKRRIEDLRKLGLVITDEHPDPNISSLLYTALPLTDAHVIPPDQLPAAPIIVSNEVPAPDPVKTVETHEDIPAITPQRIRTSDAVKHLFENLSQRREDESFYSWSSRVLQRIGIDHSMGIEQLFQETHPYEYTQIEQSTIPF